MNKITIIGTGSVGSTIAYTLTYAGIASEIVMIDINEARAQGEALDIRQGTPYTPPCYVHAGTYADAVGSNIVIITSGVARKPGQSRLDLAQINVNILKSIAPQIVKYAPDATYIIVSNPVDILTYVFCKISGIPQDRVIGSGTLLDTARLRSRLSEYYHINQQNVHAFVLGEHGDSSLIPWSLVNISNVPIFDYPKSILGSERTYDMLNVPEIEDYVRKSGARIIAGKGATFYAVSIAVCHICKSLMSDVDTALTLSTMMNGEYGISDVCLSVLCNVGRGRIQNKILLPLTENEQKQLENSAECLRAIIDQTEI